MRCPAYSYIKRYGDSVVNVVCCKCFIIIKQNYIAHKGLNVRLYEMSNKFSENMRLLRNFRKLLVFLLIYFQFMSKILNYIRIK